MPSITRSKPSTALTVRSTESPKRLRLNSFGIKLFGLIMGGALLSIAGITFLFSEIVKNQAEEQIQKILVGKVGTIHEVTDRAETLADSLGISVATLHDRKAETPETYQELTRKLFEQHPDYVIGLGFGQEEDGILPSQQWFYPYYQVPAGGTPEAQALNDKTLETVGTDPARTTQRENSANTRYVDRASEPYFYPQTETYRRYFLSQENIWTSPYRSSSEAALGTERSILLTYYSQIFDNNNRWIGTAVVDIDGSYLNETIAGPIYGQGGQLVLASEKGDIIANPANPENIESQTFSDIPGLAEIWSQLNVNTNEQTSGLIEGDRGYWSYTRIPEQSWLVLAYVPYRAVFGKILVAALSAIIPASALMTGLTILAIRYLNRRLRPMINECQRLATTKDSAAAELNGNDELEQLSTSFFNILEQLKLSQTQVQLEAAHAAEVENQLSRIKNRSTEEIEAPCPQASQQELAHLNQVVSALVEVPWLSEEIIQQLDNNSSVQKSVRPSVIELVPTGHQLHETFSRILTALTQFSQLLHAFENSQNHVLMIEDIMLTASQDIRTKADLVHQLQQGLNGCEPLTDTLTQQVHRLTEQTNHGLAISEDGLTVDAPALTSLQTTSQTLAKQLRAIARVTENTHHKTKKYQNIANMAQVLITNTSTLAISASRPQSPETLEDITAQLHSKENTLKTLAKQLETAQAEQQQSSIEAKALSDELTVNINDFEQAVRQISDAVGSGTGGQARSRGTSATMRAMGTEAIVANQQLIQRIEALRQALQKMEMLTVRENEQVAFTLKQTEQLGQMRTRVLPALPSA